MAHFPQSMRSWRPTSWLTTIFVLAAIGWLGPECCSSAEPTFQFLQKFDGGLASGFIDRSWVVVTEQGKRITISNQGSNALMVLERTEEGKYGVVFVLQGNFAGKDKGEDRRIPGAVRDITFSTPKSMAARPDGDLLFATSLRPFPSAYIWNDALKQYAIHPTTDKENEQQKQLSKMYTLAVTSDGKTVYSLGLDTLAVLARKENRPELSLVQVIEDDEKGQPDKGSGAGPLYEKFPGATIVPYLRMGEGIAISPDDAHVYVPTYNEKTITVFARDPQTFQLTLIQSFHDERVQGVYSNGNHGLGFLQGAVVSPDGKNVYFAAVYGVPVFERDPKTGRLTFVEWLTNSPAKEGERMKIEGLDYGEHIAISPDGKEVYLACSSSSSILIFDRDAKNQGRLTQRENISPARFPGAGLMGVHFVTPSPDGKYLFCATREALVTIFERKAVSK